MNCLSMLQITKQICDPTQETCPEKEKTNENKHIQVRSMLTGRAMFDHELSMI